MSAYLQQCLMTTMSVKQQQISKRIIGSMTSSLI